MQVTNNFQISVLFVKKIHLAWGINVFLKDMQYFLHFTCEPVSHKETIFTINALPPWTSCQCGGGTVSLIYKMDALVVIVCCQDLTLAVCSNLV